MEGKRDFVETPGEFLDALGASLKQKDGVDVGLAEILMAYILKAAPTQNAVAQAKDVILKLAGERAAAPKSEAVNG